MSVTITLPREYGYVLTTTAATFFLGLWHGIHARPYRVAAKMVHPKALADGTDFAAAASAEQKQALHLFNCAQRAHAHYLENQPSVAIALLIAGLKFPRLATLLGVGWMVGRVVFALGYTRKDKQNGRGRMPGFVIQFPLQLALWGLAVWTGYSWAA